VELVTSDFGKSLKLSPVWSFKETSPNSVSSNLVMSFHMQNLRMETFCQVHSMVNCFYGKETWLSQLFQSIKTLHATKVQLSMWDWWESKLLHVVLMDT
jgi:hypothetical protein